MPTLIRLNTASHKKKCYAITTKKYAYNIIKKKLNKYFLATKLQVQLVELVILLEYFTGFSKQKIQISYITVLH